MRFHFAVLSLGTKLLSLLGQCVASPELLSSEGSLSRGEPCIPTAIYAWLISCPRSHFSWLQHAVIFTLIPPSRLSVPVKCLVDSS